jgi:hypothetical protein
LLLISIFAPIRVAKPHVTDPKEFHLL